eukprot:gene728-biopygen619
MDRRTLLATLASSAAVAVTPFARAQEYPAQLIRWVVPYPAGGGTDVIARVLAESMRQTLGQQSVVDNRPGASTNIGADIVAKSKPDGYTVLSADNAVLAFNEHLFSKLPFNPEKDFTYIGAIGKFPLALVVHPDFPAKNFKDFLAYVKANPGKVNFGSSGNGSSIHLSGELFKSLAKVDMVHVPYKGSAPAVTDLLGNQIGIMFDNMPSAIQHVRSGKLVPIAVTTAKRSPELPNVPTIAAAGELGLTGQAEAGAAIGKLAFAQGPAHAQRPDDVGILGGGLLGCVRGVRRLHRVLRLRLGRALVEQRQSDQQHPAEHREGAERRVQQEGDRHVDRRPGGVEEPQGGRAGDRLTQDVKLAHAEDRGAGGAAFHQPFEQRAGELFVEAQAGVAQQQRVTHLQVEAVQQRGVH